jgi:hypothetical protein
MRFNLATLNVILISDIFGTSFLDISFFTGGTYVTSDLDRTV